MQFEIEQVKNFFDDFLEWFASLSFNSKAYEDEKIELVGCEQYSSLNAGSKFGDVTLHDKMSKYQLAQFSDLIINSKSKSLAKVFTEMNYPEKKTDRSGFGNFLGQLYDTCKSISGEKSND